MEQFVWLVSGLIIGAVLASLGVWTKFSDFSKAGNVKKAQTDTQLSRDEADKIVTATALEGDKRLAKLLHWQEKNQMIKQPLLIPVQGLGYPEQALKIGFKLALLLEQPLHLVVLVEIPQTQSLDSNMDAEMEEALQILEKVENKAALVGVAVDTSITKVRNYTTGITDAACETAAKWVILEQTNLKPSLHAPTLSQQTEVIGRKTSCNVILLNPVQRVLSPMK